MIKIAFFLLFGLFFGQSSKDILNDFFISTNGKNWTINTNWNETDDVCNWFGIDCNDNEDVTGVYLQGNNLQGPIPESFGYLTSLESFDFSVNKINGSLPESLSSLKNLQAIGLRLNNLTGSFPQFFAALPLLGYVHIDFNHLSGALPDIFASLPNLAVLTLTGNNLSGSLPHSLGSAVNLNTLALGQNQFQDRFPQFIANLTKLQIIDLSQNHLSGPISDVFSSLTSLTELLLFRNAFTGALPNSLLSLPRLSVIAVGDNRITSFPEGLGLSKSLFLFYIENNLLTGKIPESLADNVTSVSVANLSGNPFECPIPPEFAWTEATCNGTTEKESEERGRRKKVEVKRRKSPPRTRPVPPPFGIDADPVQLIYFGVSKCPDMRALEWALFNISEDFDPYYTLVPGILSLDAPAYPTGRWSLHGQTEVIGSVAELCAYTLDNSRRPLKNTLNTTTYNKKGERKSRKAGGPQSKAWRNFVSCELEDQGSIPSRVKECANSTGFVWDELRDCIVNKGIDLLDASQKQADSVNAIWSPTLYFNGGDKCLFDLFPCSVQAGTNAIEQKICSLYEGSDKPTECSA